MGENEHSGDLSGSDSEMDDHKRSLLGHAGDDESTPETTMRGLPTLAPDTHEAMTSLREAIENTVNASMRDHSIVPDDFTIVEDVEFGRGSTVTIEYDGETHEVEVSDMDFSVDADSLITSSEYDPTEFRERSANDVKIPEHVDCRMDPFELVDPDDEAESESEERPPGSMWFRTEKSAEESMTDSTVAEAATERNLSRTERAMLLVGFSRRTDANRLEIGGTRVYRTVDDDGDPEYVARVETPEGWVEVIREPANQITEVGIAELLEQFEMDYPAAYDALHE